MTTEPFRLMAILAHPDDESLGIGGTLARCAAEGVETYVITATRGERGWQGAPEENPGLEALGRLREAELKAAIRILGVHELTFLGYLDGDLDQANPAEVVMQLVAHVRRVRPHVIVTFGPEGGYGHPDHIAISQLTAAALISAADAAYLPDSAAAYRVPKFYYRVWTHSEQRVYQAVFGDIVMQVDGVARTFVGWEEWAPTARINTASYWPTVWKAISYHASQLPQYEQLAQLSEEQHRKLWGRDGYLRVYSTVNGGRAVEDDLFAGLR